MTFVARSISRMYICGRGVSFILIEAAHSPVFRSETPINSTFTFDSTFTNPGTRAQPKFAVNSRRRHHPAVRPRPRRGSLRGPVPWRGSGRHWFHHSAILACEAFTQPINDRGQ